MKVYCVISLETPHRGNSNVYIQYTISPYEKENYPKKYQICSYGMFFLGTQNVFESAISVPAIEVLLYTQLFRCFAKTSTYWHLTSK